MEEPSPSSHSDLTTLHVARARDGDAASLEWIVERFSPLLLAQARYRLGSSMAQRIAPEDVVQDAWALTLPHLARLEQRDGRSTPVLLRFLSTTLLRQVNNLLRLRVHSSERMGDSSSPFRSLSAETRGPLTRAMQHESCERVLAAIDELDERDRALVVLRAIEQRDNTEVAQLLGLAPNTAAQAFRRALEKLRGRLRTSAFDELGDSDA
jgi:RNA polymerase sigma factor (sigma-70 family)